MKIHFVWGFCMGAQDAKHIETVVSGPGSTRGSDTPEQARDGGAQQPAALGRLQGPPQGPPLPPCPDPRPHDSADASSLLPVQPSRSRTPLRRCCGRSHLRRVWQQAVWQLLNAGLSLHDVDACGNTPLHLAVAGGNVEVAMCLLQNGAGHSLSVSDPTWRPG